MPVLKDVKYVTRDGIKIDRNTGATKKGAKFDYDVVPAGTEFDLNIELENIENYQLDLIGLALNDILKDNGDLFGGKTSRGIGKCRLKDLKMKYVTSDDKEKLRIITASLDEKSGIKNTCKEFNSKYKLAKIPSTHGKYNLLHECYENSGVNAKETISYSKEYVEKLAKSIFGSSYKLNTELPLSYCSCAKTCNDATSEIGYYLNKASNLYVHYSGNDAAGGIGCVSIQHSKKIVSAEKINDEITLDILYTSKPGLDNSESSTSEFIYKFKKDKDNNYYLVSKTKKK